MAQTISTDTSWSRPKLASLTIRSPCYDLFELNDWLTPQEEVYVELCRKTYDKRVVPTIKALASCHGMRNKRNLMDALAGMAVEVIRNGVTNFLNKFPSPVPNPDQLAHNLFWNVQKNSVQKLKNHQGKTTDAKEIALYSESPYNHLQGGRSN